MQRYMSAASIALLILLTGCDDYRSTSASLRDGIRLKARRAAVLASARQSVAFVRQVEQVFSGCNTSAGEGRLGWDFDFELGLYGRYVIKGRAPLTVDTNKMVVVGSGPPTIYIYEVNRIIPSPDGVGGAVKFTTNQVQLGAGEWAKLFDSRGDFATVGYTMITNMPVPHFEIACHYSGSVKR